MSLLVRDVIQCPRKEPFAGFEKALVSALKYTNSVRAFSETMDHYGWLVPLLKANTLCGVEVEVERIKANIPVPGFITQKGDGSLRADGKEFTTAPLKPDSAMQALVLLWILLDKTNRGVKPDFSWRTSDHFHLDVTELTEEEFQRFLILCVIFDKLLFLLGGESRAQSVFCVPFEESSLTTVLRSYIHKKKNIIDLVENWMKYSSVNLKRMLDGPHGEEKLGTVEFRHFAGNRKLENLLVWMATIIQIYKYAKAHSGVEFKYQVQSLNCTSNYAAFAAQVLGKELVSRMKIQWKDAFCSGVATAKRILAKEPELKVTTKSSLGHVVSSHLKKKEEQVKKEEAKRKELKQQYMPPPNWAAFSAPITSVAFDPIFDDNEF